MNYPAIPKGPLTIFINGMIMDAVFAAFIEKFLPAYDVEVTSGYRTPDENEKTPGAAEFSAHLYNLARDFVLKDKSGNYVSSDKLKAIFEQFIKPNWKGYSYYNPPKTGNTGWVHVNLDRSITNQTKLIDWALSGIGVFMIVRKFIGSLKQKGGKYE